MDNTLKIISAVFLFLMFSCQNYDRDLVIDYSDEIINEQVKLTKAHEGMQKYLLYFESLKYGEDEADFIEKIDNSLIFIDKLGPIYGDNSFQEEFTRYANQMKRNVEEDFTMIIHYISISDSLITEKDIEEMNILGEQSISNIKNNEAQFDNFYKSFAKKYGYEIAY
jgi:hypothetical protein